MFKSNDSASNSCIAQKETKLEAKHSNNSAHTCMLYKNFRAYFPAPLADQSRNKLNCARRFYK